MLLRPKLDQDLPVRVNSMIKFIFLDDTTVERTILSLNKRNNEVWFTDGSFIWLPKLLNGIINKKCIIIKY